MIEPSLIGQNSSDQQRSAEHRDRDLDNHLGARALGNSHEPSLTLLESAVSIWSMRSSRLQAQATLFDRLLKPVHRWIWGDVERRVQKLLRFGETEIDGGRDILRAAELTSDPLLRRLYLEHAIDEFRHGLLFRNRAGSVLRELGLRSKPAVEIDWLAPGGHGLDDLRLEKESDGSLLAFLHLSEKAAASRFAIYHDVMQHDPPTRAIFEEILHDERFHMSYTLTHLVRVAPERHRRHLWRARLSRLWKGYLRLATALAGAVGTLILGIQYFIVLPPFAWLAKRAARRELPGWSPIALERNGSLRRQY